VMAAVPAAAPCGDLFPVISDRERIASPHG